MIKEHPSISILKKFNPANPNTLAEVLAEDFIWHYYNPVLPELEGDYFGLSGLTDFFNRLAGRSKGSFKVNPISITPMGDELVVTHVKDNMNLGGQQIEVEAVVVWRLVDGKIKEAWDIPAVYTAEISDI